MSASNFDDGEATSPGIRARGPAHLGRDVADTTPWVLRALRTERVRSSSGVLIGTRCLRCGRWVGAVAYGVNDDGACECDR